MFREFFVRQIGLYKAPIKPHYISPIPMKNSSKNKIWLKKDNTDNISISKIRNFGLVTYTNKNLRNNVLNSRYTSKSSLKTQTNSSKYFLTTSSTFNNLILFFSSLIFSFSFNKLTFSLFNFIILFCNKFFFLSKQFLFPLF